MTYSKLIIWWLFFIFNGFIIPGDSSLRNCKRVWGMSNTINNIPMYSTGLYMCVETPDGIVLDLPDNSNSIDSLKTVVKNISNSTIFTNSTKFLSNSTTSNFLSQNNKTLISQNSTNNTTILLSNNSLSLVSPSPSTTSTTPVTTTSPAPITTTSPAPVTTATTTTTTTTTVSPIHIIYNNTSHNQILNESTNKFDEQIIEEMNPLLPTIIILSSIVGCCILSGGVYFCYKKGLCNRKKCSKTLPEAQIEKDLDLESGEKSKKKGRNSWTVMTTTLNARRKLKELETYKNKKALKPRLKSISKNQKDKVSNVHINKNLKKTSSVAGLRHHETKRRDNKLIRNHMEEQSSRIPGGMNNPSLQRMMNRFPKSPRQQKLDSMNLDMSPDQQEWYKKKFSNELTGNKDKYPNLPSLPPGNPPPPLPEVARSQVQKMASVVYGNKKNDNSPKMTIRELNPEEN